MFEEPLQAHASSSVEVDFPVCCEYSPSLSIEPPEIGFAVRVFYPFIPQCVSLIPLQQEKPRRNRTNADASKLYSIYIPRNKVDIPPQTRDIPPQINITRYIEYQIPGALANQDLIFRIKAGIHNSSAAPRINVRKRLSDPSMRADRTIAFLSVPNRVKPRNKIIATASVRAGRCRLSLFCFHIA